jgi:hypothetical protein
MMFLERREVKFDLTPEREIFIMNLRLPMVHQIALP